MEQLKNSKIICPNCHYDLNPPNNDKCDICGESLFPSQQLNQVITNKPQGQTVTKQQLYKKPRNKQVQPVNHSKLNNWQKELLKPQNASGIVVGFISLLLLTHQLFFNSNNATAKVDKIPQVESVNGGGIKLVRAIKDVENVPGGIFSYSGDGYFAALLKAGLVAEIVNAFPNFASRYTSPSYEDPSYSVAIDMLLAGDIDFVFNARPLSPTEYAKAKLQNIQLQENAIAVDGIVFYTHPELTVNKITIKELMSIFQGKISNWQQLGGKDLPITPVILSKENVEALGFEVSDNAKIDYASNHTLAVRKVIDTPGAIGYASASLVQNQSLLKFLTLGQSSVVNPEVVNYVDPFLSDGQTNKEAFSRGTYPLVRRLTLVNTDRPNSEAAGTAISNIILSGQGQAYVDDAGFVSLRGQKK
ncbi:MAG: substrate-binding domain-containing protein [Xenococcaceae cyanobacterium MO_188.B19]|nr:substrate-binding domain-containing protein [Xenococcaceae cyanobacterium MO_188.B19]